MRAFLRRLLLRRLSMLAAVLSLGLSVATAMLWVRSHRRVPPHEDRLTWLSRGGRRYTLRSEAGRLGLFASPKGNPAAPPLFGPRSPEDLYQFGHAPAPPSQAEWEQSRPPPRPGVDSSLDQVLSQLQNDQVRWCAGCRYDEAARVTVQQLYCMGPRSNAPALRLEPATVFRHREGPNPFDDPPPFSDADVVAGLLAALEDPERFVAAHVLLSRRPPAARVAKALEVVGRADGSGVASFDGLRVNVFPSDASMSLVAPVQSAGKPIFNFWDSSPAVKFDPAQIPAVRDLWHRRLDVQVGSVSHRFVTFAAGLPALFWIAAAIRRRRVLRRRCLRGECLHCGYDLRGSSARCSECGADVPLRAEPA